MGYSPIDETRRRLEPVIDWYQSDETGPRSLPDIVGDVVADLQDDRTAILAVQRLAREAQKDCTEGKPISAFNLAQDILRVSDPAS